MLFPFFAAMRAAPVILALGGCATPPVTETAGYSCALSAQASGTSTDVIATLTATQDVTGIFALTIGQSASGSSALINQGGGFEAAAGTTVTLGSTRMTGAGLSGQFTVTVGATTTTCAITGPLAVHN